MLRKIFHNKFLRVCFAAIHPRWTIALAHKWSSHSRITGGVSDFLGEDKEFLIQFAKQEIKQTPDIDYFIFGHRHLSMTMELKNDSQIILLGDWLKHSSYAEWDGNDLTLKTPD